MAALETRMILLGVVGLFEPVNGYQIRRELLSWRVAEWASMNTGSIYSGLRTLTKQGHLTRHDIHDSGRDVAVYTLTATGREEFARLVEQGMTQPQALSLVAFHAAFNMTRLVRREDYLNHLRARRTNLRACHQLDVPDLKEHEHRVRAELETMVPHHVVRAMELRRNLVKEELTWLDEIIADIENGGFDFLGEPMKWTPAPEDAGWQIAEEAKRYRAILER